MIQIQRCWVCGNLASERQDDPLMGELYYCDQHYELVKETK